MYERDHKHGYTGRHMNRSGGFTLLELMVTVAVAGVLMMVAIPAYQGMVQRNTMTSTINDLVGDIYYARSEAITRGTRVSICPSDGQPKCTGNWLNGWIVYPGNTPSDGELLRVHGAVTTPQLTVKDNKGNPITFGGSGFATGSARTITIGTDNSSDVTCLVVSFVGRVSTESGYYDATTEHCAEDST